MTLYVCPLSNETKDVALLDLILSFLIVRQLQRALMPQQTETKKLHSQGLCWLSDGKAKKRLVKDKLDPGDFTCPNRLDVLR